MSVLILLSLFTICCKKTENLISIKFIPSAENVCLQYNESWNTISAINLPLNFDVENHGFAKEHLVRFSYKYGNKMEGQATRLFLRRDNKFEKQNNSENIYIKGFKTNSYRIRTKHFIDTTKFNNSFFKPYIEEMQLLNQDTLSIGTISDLKVKHRDLFNNLVQNDSISFFFLDENSEKGYREKVFQVAY